MPARIREIKGRIKAVANIKRITKTMQMIATARFQAALRRATASQPYTRKIGELMAEVAATTGGSITHPLLRTEQRAGGRRLVLVLTSNRGLCGGYNGSVLRKAMAHLRAQEATPIDLELVGKKGLAFFRFNRVPVSQFHSQFTDQPLYEEVERLAESYMEAFSADRYDAMDVVYMAFHSAARQSPQVLNLLPLQKPQVAQAAGEQGAAVAQVQYEFSPDPESLLAELLPVTVKTQLFQCFNEAVVSEQVARMVAMKSATDAAGKMGKSLTRQYNRARQAAITTELTEVISGSLALE